MRLIFASLRQTFRAQITRKLFKALLAAALLSLSRPPLTPVNAISVHKRLEAQMCFFIKGLKNLAFLVL